MSSVTIVYLLTAVVSILVALLLTQLAKQSGRAKALAAQREKDGRLASDLISDESLRHTIFNEISKLVNSMQECQEISTRLLNSISRELEKKINHTTQELTKKYEAIVEEKTKNEEIAWNKYDRVLTDKKKTEAVIRSIAEGLVVVDAGGDVVMMNPAAERMLGVSRKDKIGKRILDDLKEEQLVALVKDSPNREEKEIELISQQDETKKILRASSAVIENEHGQTVGMVSVLSDITKQKELDRMKSSFVANVSHELRTPLVAIDKSLSLILSKSTGEISETQEQFLTLAERNLKRLSLLVNDLLDLAKLEAGKMEIRPMPESIDKVIYESVETLNTWAKTKSINIETKIESGLPQVNIDSARIIQVLNNLIGNAIKFTPNNGSIVVEIKLMQKERRAIEVSVTDTGVGIAGDDLPKVFDKFYQAGERVSTDINGTGIGLSIAKEIVELHGGKIWVESGRGNGAKFIFRLPLT